MARIAVTGATGFVGGRVAQRLAARGDDVVALVRRESPELAADGVAQVIGGLSATEAIAGCDTLVHAAATTGPALDDARAVNVTATRHLGAAAAAAGARYVHISTTSVYDRSSMGDEPVDETAPLASIDSAPNPASSAPAAYGLSKAEGDRVVADLVADGLSAAVLRPPAVLGAGPTSTWGTRVPQRIRDREGWTMHPDTTFAWVHIDDLVDAILAAADASVVVTANVVGGHCPAGDYLAAVAEIVGAPVPGPPDGVEPWRGRYTSDRLAEELGVVCKRTFADAMAEIADSWADGPRT